VIVNSVLRVFVFSIPACIGLTLCLSPFHPIASDNKAIAAETQNEGSFQANQTPILESQPLLQAETEIKPSHWTYQALKSLVERYGCAQNITNAPSNPFNPIRPMTRREVAITAGICLAKIGDRFTSKQDQKMAVALQREFKAELDNSLALGDKFKANSTTLEAQQFSTDTKSHPEVLYASPDWIIQSLKTLAARYECTTGLNLPWKPEASDDRYELAWELNSCLDQSMIRFGSFNDKDQAIIDKLWAEFRPETEVIRKHNDALEARTKELAHRELSPTTKVIVDRVLPDVTPTQWNAVKSLIVKYRCISGNPQALFQPDRTTTRYELAAALNACLRRNNNRFATQQEREIAQRLQQELQPELTAIQQRTKDLETRAALLESQQFSPTSKLQGQTVITIQGGGF
jgi:hypothetical protein